MTTSSPLSPSPLSGWDGVPCLSTANSAVDFPFPVLGGTCKATRRHRNHPTQKVARGKEKRM
eukprot:614731-Prorocentrum_minimum.AAC.2